MLLVRLNRFEMCFNFGVSVAFVTDRENLACVAGGTSGSAVVFWRRNPGKRVSMGWWLLRLSAKILVLLRLSANFFSVTVNKKVKN